jgi:hypothetical protein
MPVRWCPEATDTLSTEQIDGFVELGFCTLRRAFTPQCAVRSQRQVEATWCGPVWRRDPTVFPPGSARITGCQFGGKICRCDSGPFVGHGQARAGVGDCRSPLWWWLVSSRDGGQHPTAGQAGGDGDGGDRAREVDPARKPLLLLPLSASIALDDYS